MFIYMYIDGLFCVCVWGGGGFIDNVLAHEILVLVSHAQKQRLILFIVFESYILVGTHELFVKFYFTQNTKLKNVLLRCSTL